MRACARCGHENPEPLVYCYQCGGNLRGRAGGTDAPTGRTGGAIDEGPGGNDRGGALAGPTAAFAATVALTSASHPAGAPVSTIPSTRPGPIGGAWHAVAHL